MPPRQSRGEPNELRSRAAEYPTCFQCKAAENPTCFQCKASDNPTFFACLRPSVRLNHVGMPGLFLFLTFHGPFKKLGVWLSVVHLQTFLRGLPSLRDPL